MAKIGSFFAAVASVALVFAPSAASAQDSVAQALSLHSSGKAQAAYELLLPQVETRAGDPDFDYAFGLAAADSGHAGEALAALQRVLAVQPNNTQARAEIARVYALAGDIDTARAQFDTVLADPTIPDPVRQRIDVLSRQYGTAIRGGARSLTGLIDLEAGYDSNVNAATSSSSITFPLFAFLGPAALSGNAVAQDKGFAQATGGISFEAPLSRQTRAFVSGQGLVREIFDNSAFDQAALGGTVGIARTLVSGDVVSLAANAQNFWLGDDSYRQAFGGVAQLTHRIRGGAALSAALNYSRFNYDNDPSRDADRYALTVSYAGRALYGSLTSGLEEVRRDFAPNLGFAFTGVQAGFEKLLTERFALTGSAGLEHRNYRGTDPLFLASRGDTQGDVSIGFRVLLAEGLTLRPRATYTRNWSNLSLYDYERATVSMALRKEF